MPLPACSTLLDLQGLSPGKLHQTSLRIRCDYARSQWKLAMCLLAMVRTGAFRRLKFSTISEYAERALHLSGRKAGELLAAARVLEHHPRLSAAFQDGTLCWTKLRAIQTLVTPASESMWLEFARSRRSCEVEQMVAMSPSSWKRQKGLQAFLEGHPNATADEVAAFLSRPLEGPTPVEQPAVSAGESTGQTASGSLFEDSPGVVAVSAPLMEEGGRSGSPLGAKDEAVMEGGAAAPGLPGGASPGIRLTAVLTPDEYALFDMAESRIRASHGRRLRLGAVLAKMAGIVVDSGTARSRARHLVVVHRDQASDTAWYETSRGRMPVSPEMREEIERTALVMSAETVSHGGDALAMESAEVAIASEFDPIADAEARGADTARADGKSGARGSTRRREVPVAVLRALYARAGNRCEACWRHGGRLHVHHRCPVSEGGGETLDMLRTALRGMPHVGAPRGLRQQTPLGSGSSGCPVASARQKRRPASRTV